ncbi:HEAT repeat domain-containing protein [Thermodesulfobacteriota bacterium]
MSQKNLKTVKIISVIAIITLFSIYAFSYYNSGIAIKEEENKMINSLIERLKSGDKTARAEALSAATSIGSAAVKPLLTALEAEDQRFRKRAADALVEIGESAVKPLIGALEDKHQKIRRTAAFALSKGNPDWVKSDAAINEIPNLIETLASKDKYLREDAALMLSKIGTPAVEQLIRALKNDNWHVREYAASALGRIRDERSVEPLITTLNDEYWQVRRTAIHALGSIADARAYQPIMKIQKIDKHADVKFAANKAIKRLAMLVDTTIKSEEATQ